MGYHEVLVGCCEGAGKSMCLGYAYLFVGELLFKFALKFIEESEGEFGCESNIGHAHKREYTITQHVEVVPI